MAGIAKSVETIQDVGEVVVDVATLVKGGVSLGNLGHLLAILNDVKELIADARQALPELADVDAAEAGQLATAAYTQIKRIVVAVVG